jgi:aminocarboxymuconate-semialdehyde decarboxylase
MPRLLAYELDPSDGLELSRYLNQCITKMITSAPDRFYGLGSVPLQDTNMATAELTRIQDMGLNGVEVLTNINGKNLGDIEFRPFLREAERLGMAIFSHAQHPTFPERMVGPNPVQNAVGFPIENGLAASAVITSGVLEECPQLRILFSHGGGVLSTILPRLENAWQRQEVLQATLPKSPMEYARMCYFDDVVFDNRALRYLIDMIGFEQIVIGSDYPFAFRSQIPEEMFISLNMPKEEKAAISSKNAMRFLGIQ